MIEIDFSIKPVPIIPEYVIDGDGNKRLYDDNDKLHSYNDLPSYIGADGTKIWHKHGKRHRDNAPAGIWLDGRKEYWINGEPIK